MRLENETRYCLFCDSSFTPIRSNQLYCSKKHRNRLWKPVKTICTICNNEFRKDKVNQEYCSSNCRQLKRLRDNYVNQDVPKSLFIGDRQTIVNNILNWAKEKGYTFEEDEE